MIEASGRGSQDIINPEASEAPTGWPHHPMIWEVLHRRPPILRELVARDAELQRSKPRVKRRVAEAALNQAALNRRH